MTNEVDISLLSQREHVRKRPSMFVGSTVQTKATVPHIEDGAITFVEIEYVPSSIRCVNEIIENSCDEHIRNQTLNPILRITYYTHDKIITIVDNGSGVPIGKHATGLPTPQVVYGYLGSGSNFSDDKQAGMQGQNGVGGACVNFCSKFFTVDINRNKKHYQQKFFNGAETIEDPVVHRTTHNETGTSITFQLDDEVFVNNIPSVWFKIKANEISRTFNIPVYLTLTHVDNEETYISSETSTTFLKQENYTLLTDVNCEIYIIDKQSEQKSFGWVNGGYLFDGGTCCADTSRKFVQMVTEYLAPTITKEKLKISKDDILEFVTLFVNLKVSDPLYDSQAKTRFKGPSQKTLIDKIFDEQFKLFVKKNPKYFDTLLTTIRNKSNKRAIQQFDKKVKLQYIEGYLKATAKDRTNTWLLINEGLSAASSVVTARDPELIGSLSVGGKLNNIHECTPAQLLSMQKIIDIMNVIGLVPGKFAKREELNYNHIVIATDADPDGDGMFVNLVNLFYQNWPELLVKQKEPFLYRMQAPNIVAVTNKTRIHFHTKEQFDANKHKIKTKYEVEYMKGLGSMTIQDWKMCLEGFNFLPIFSDDEMKEWLSIFFGDSSDKRKEWLGKCRV